MERRAPQLKTETMMDGVCAQGDSISDRPPAWVRDFKVAELAGKCAIASRILLPVAAASPISPSRPADLPPLVESRLPARR